MFQQLFIVAVLAAAAVVVLRLVQALRGRASILDGKGRRWLLAFLVLPPMVLGAVIQPAPGGGLLAGVFWIPIYAVIVGVLKLVLTIAAVIVNSVLRGRPRRLLVLALAGGDGDRDEVESSPTVTPRLAERIALVDQTNAAFPRGVDFPAQVDRADFASAWGALDDATRALEAAIADDRRLGLGVASTARTTAIDARSRLLTLRSIATSRGMAAAS